MSGNDAATVRSTDRGLQTVVDLLTRQTPGITWSIRLTTLDGRDLASHRADALQPTASVGKLLLLTEVARQLESGSLSASERLQRSPELAVADSGVWQHLAVEALPVADLAVLVGGVSDNLATNVLLERIGLAAVRAVGPMAGLTATRLLDRVRELRGPADPPHLSEGSARELAGFMRAVRNGELLSPAVSAHLQRWLSTNVDLSMVAAPFALDPLAHVHPDRGITLRNKTGTNTDVRADVGYVEGAGAGASYAVLAHWDGEADQRDAAMASMWQIGEALRALVE